MSETTVTTEPKALVDFDHLSQEYRNRGVEMLAEMRDKCPVSFSDRYGGFWLISRYGDVARVGADAFTFSSHYSTGGDLIGGPPLADPLCPAWIDPPEMVTYRKMLNRVFSPAAVRRMRAQIRRATDDAIDAFIESGAAEIVMELATAIPSTTALQLLGVPTDGWQRYAHAMHNVLYQVPGTPEFDRALEDSAWMIEQIHNIVEERKRNPCDDVISEWATTEVDGAPIRDTYIRGMIFLVIAGGTETTGSALANSMLYLAQHPEMRARLRENPDQIPTACEELLRWVTPTQHVARTATCDVEVGGQLIRAGDRIMMNLASANRDSDQFDDPDEVILDRAPNRHSAFGLGPHRCLGSHLGRAMLVIMLTQALTRLGDYEIVGEPERYPATGSFNGLISMNITFEPGARLRPAPTS